MASTTLRNHRLKIHRDDYSTGPQPSTVTEIQGPGCDGEVSWDVGNTDPISVRRGSGEKKRTRRVRQRETPQRVSRSNKTAMNEQLRSAETYRRHQLSRMPLDLDGWDVYASLSEKAPAIAHGGLFDWSMHDSGCVRLAAASTVGTGLAAAFASVSLLSALRAHGRHAQTPAEMLARLNQDLWRGSAGDQYANSWYATLDPSSGQLDYSVAGSAGLFICRSGKTEAIDGLALPALGVDPETQFFPQRLQLRSGETLLIALYDQELANKNTIQGGLADWLFPIPRMTAKELVEVADGLLRGASCRPLSLLAVRCCAS